MPGGGGGGGGVGTSGTIANVLLMRPFSRLIVATPPRVPSDTEGAVGTAVSNQSLDTAAASATKAVVNDVDNSVGRKWQNRILIIECVCGKECCRILQRTEATTTRKIGEFKYS